jgi:SAM-dependent methyltransferase
MPIDANEVDVVISNCVVNLVPDKRQAFQEIYRVLKPGGHVCIADIVLRGELPSKLKERAAVYAGCVAGAMQYEEYLNVIREAGFSDLASRSWPENQAQPDYAPRHRTPDAGEQPANLYRHHMLVHNFGNMYTHLVPTLLFDKLSASPRRNPALGRSGVPCQACRRSGRDTVPTPRRAELVEEERRNEDGGREAVCNDFRKPVREPMVR